MDCYVFNLDGLPGGGLTIQQWLISIFIGSIGIFWCIFLKFVDETKCCPNMGSREKDPLSGRGVLSIKKNSSKLV